VLTRDQRAVAANDVGFWPALIRLHGAHDSGLEKTRDVRRRDLMAQGRDSDGVQGAFDWLDNMAFREGRARRLTTAGKPGLHDLILIDCPAEHGPYIGDALYEWALQDDILSEDVKAGKPVPMMALQGDMGSAEAPNAALFLSGVDGLADFVPAFAAMARDAGLICWAGGDGKAGYFGATGDPDALDILADHILCEIVTGARPVRGWRAQFFQALETTGRNSGKPPEY